LVPTGQHQLLVPLAEKEEFLIGAIISESGSIHFKKKHVNIHSQYILQYSGRGRCFPFPLLRGSGADTSGDKPVAVIYSFPGLR
jgi:hypothetical protein